MRRYFIIIGILSFTMSGCSASITNFKDELTGADIVRMSGNKLGGGLGRIELNAQRFEKDGVPSYSLMIVYAGPAYINIEQGQTLFITVDEARNVLNGSGSGKHRFFVSPGLVEETAYYHDVRPDIICEIAYGNCVEVMIHGLKSDISRVFSKRNFKAFQSFLDICSEKDRRLANRIVKDHN